jgi:hypothetical protein
MNHGMLSTFLLISAVSCPAVAQGQSLGADNSRHANSIGTSGMTGTTGGSWESWLNHGARDVTPESQVPARSPDLGRATAPLSPSIGPKSGLIGPEAGSSPSRLQSNREIDFGGTAADRSRR